MILIASHVVFAPSGEPIHGTGTEIGTFLQKRQEPYFFIKHALYGDFPTLVDGYTGRGLTTRSYGWKNLFFSLKIIQDQIINFYFLLKTREKIKVFIGIDPLNAFSGILAKKIGKVEKLVFYTADYAHQRFENSFLNRFYHWLDLLAIKQVDAVWNVSTRITEQRRKQGVPREKNFLVPNTPYFAQCVRLPNKKINKHDLVIVGNITKVLDCEIAIEAVKKLSPKYPDIRLWIIGVGDHLKALQKLAKRQKVSERVFFPGRMEHNQLLKFLPACAIGVALYRRDCPWNEFRDSVKAREYLACGLPVIISDSPSTAADIKKAKAGLTVKNTEIELEKAVDRLFSNYNLYAKIRQNAIELSRKYDFGIVMDNVLSKILK